MIEKLLLLLSTFFLLLVFSSAQAIPLSYGNAADVTDSMSSLLSGSIYDSGDPGDVMLSDVAFADQEGGSIILSPVADDLEKIVQAGPPGEGENTIDEVLATASLAVMAWEAGEERRRVVPQISQPVPISKGTARSIRDTCWKERDNNPRKPRSSWEEICPGGGAANSGTGRGGSSSAEKQAGERGFPSGVRRWPGNPISNAGGGGGVGSGAAGGGVGSGAARGAGISPSDSNNGNSGDNDGGPGNPPGPGNTGGGTDSAPWPGNNGDIPVWETVRGGDEVGNGEAALPSEIAEIPEPPSLMLLALALASMCLAKYRKRSVGKR